MDGPTGYYAQRNKSVRERQILYDFTYIQNLKNRINEPTKLKQTQRYRERTGGCQKGGGLGHWAKKVKGLRSTN